METNKTEMFREASVPKAVFMNTIPAMLSMVMVLVYNLADTFFIGQTGDPYMVASVSFALPVFMIPLAFGTLFGIGGTSVISRAMGRADTEYAKKVSSFCFWAGNLIGLILMLVFLFFADPISKALGATSEETFQYTRDYLAYVSWSAVFIIFANAFSNIIRAEGQSLHAMAGLMIGNIVNIILDPIFIFPLKMGVKGAAIATVIGNMVGASYYLIYFLRGRSMLSLSIKDFRCKEKIASSVFAIGISASLVSILMSVVTIMVNSRMVNYGDLAVAGYGISTKVHMVISTIIVGLGQGIQPLLGYCYGAQLWNRYKSIMRFSLIYATIVSTVLTVLCVIFVEPLVSMFLSEASAFSFGVEFSLIGLASGPIFGLLYVLLNALQSINEAKSSFIISASRQGFIFIPLLFLMQAILGRNGLVWTQPIADVLSCIMAIILFKIAMKRKMPLQ